MRKKFNQLATTLSILISLTIAATSSFGATLSFETDKNASTRKKVELLESYNGIKELERLEQSGTDIHQIWQYYATYGEIFSKWRKDEDAKHAFKRALEGINTVSYDGQYSYMAIKISLATTHIFAHETEEAEAIVKEISPIINSTENPSILTLRPYFHRLDAELSFAQGDRDDYLKKMGFLEQEVDSILIQYPDDSYKWANAILQSYMRTGEIDSAINLTKKMAETYQKTFNLTEESRNYLNWWSKKGVLFGLKVRGKYDEMDALISEYITTKEIPDNFKLEFLRVKESNEIELGNYSSALSTNNEIYLLCKKTKDQKEDCDLEKSLFLSSYYLNKDQKKHAIEELNKAEAIFSAIEKDLDIQTEFAHTIYANLAVLNFAIGNYNSALIYNDKALIFARTIGNPYPQLASRLRIQVKRNDMPQAVVVERDLYDFIHTPHFRRIGSIVQENKSNDSNYLIDPYFQLTNLNKELYTEHSFQYAQAITFSNVEQSLISSLESSSSKNLKNAIASKRNLLTKLGSNVSIDDIEDSKKIKMKLIADLEKADTLIKELTNNRFEYLLSTPASLNEIRSSLKNNEALVFFKPGEKNYYAWTISPERHAFIKIDESPEAIEKAAKSLRKSVEINDNGEISEYSFDTALNLYNKLIKPLEASISGASHIYLVCDGVLIQVPFSALITKSKGKNERIKWLAEKYSFSLLPSPRSLLTLNKRQKSAADKPFLGVGDPSLNGIPIPSSRGALRSIGYKSGDMAKSAVKMLPQLPDTRGELYSIANSLGAIESDLFLGEKATKKAIMSLPLDSYRIIAFATHGLLAGEVGDLTEPGLVLTPTDDKDDNGVLGASDIMSLKLDSDWIILSACNTASSDRNYTNEGLSGLASSFFYAGARSLLVSNWKVDSKTAALLTTRSVELVANKKAKNKADALRQAMIEVASMKGYEHPFYWAPFTAAGSIRN